MTDARGQLLGVLDNAASQQPDKVKTAQQQLKQWETSPDFYATLQVSRNSVNSNRVLSYSPNMTLNRPLSFLLKDIFYDKSLPINLRFVAGLYLKNGIDAYWRKTAKKYVNQ